MAQFIQKGSVNRNEERASRLPFSVISINPAAQAPLYRQLYDEFRAAILAGRLKAGNKPHLRASWRMNCISRNTVVAAYDQLHLRAISKVTSGQAPGSPARCRRRCCNHALARAVDSRESAAQGDIETRREVGVGLASDQASGGRKDAAVPMRPSRSRFLSF